MSIDLANEFWSIPLDEMSTGKTAFTLQVGPGYPRDTKIIPTYSIVQNVLEGKPVTVYIDDMYWTNEDEATYLDIPGDDPPNSGWIRNRSKEM